MTISPNNKAELGNIQQIERPLTYQELLRCVQIWAEANPFNNVEDSEQRITGSPLLAYITCLFTTDAPANLKQPLSPEVIAGLKFSLHTTKHQTSDPDTTLITQVIASRVLMTNKDAPVKNTIQEIRDYFLENKDRFGLASTLNAHKALLALCYLQENVDDFSQGRGCTPIDLEIGDHEHRMYFHLEKYRNTALRKQAIQNLITNFISSFNQAATDEKTSEFFDGIETGPCIEGATRELLDRRTILASQKKDSNEINLQAFLGEVFVGYQHYMKVMGIDPLLKSSTARLWAARFGHLKADTGEQLTEAFFEGYIESVLVLDNEPEHYALPPGGANVGAVVDVQTTNWLPAAQLEHQAEHHSLTRRALGFFLSEKVVNAIAPMQLINTNYLETPLRSSVLLFVLAAYAPNRFFKLLEHFYATNPLQLTEAMKVNLLCLLDCERTTHLPEAMLKRLKDFRDAKQSWKEVLTFTIQQQQAEKLSWFLHTAYMIPVSWVIETIIEQNALSCLSTLKQLLPNFMRIHSKDVGMKKKLLTLALSSPALTVHDVTPLITSNIGLTQVEMLDCMHLAIREGKVEIITLMLSRNLWRYTCRSDAEHPLVFAATYGQWEAVEAILANPKQLQMRSAIYNKTALKLAAGKQWALLESFINKVTSFEVFDDESKFNLYGYMVLANYLVIDGQDTSLFKKIKTHSYFNATLRYEHMDINDEETVGPSALHIALLNPEVSLQTLTALFDLQISLYTPYDELNPFQLAAKLGCVDKLRLLCKRFSGDVRGNLSFPDENNMLFLAIKHKQWRCVEGIADILRYARITPANKKNLTSIAALKLIENKAPWDLVQKLLKEHDFSPHYSLPGKPDTLLTRLIQKNHLLKENKYTEVFTLLQNHPDFDINHVPQAGFLTPMALAANVDNVTPETLETILRLNPSNLLCNKRTALEYAIQRNSEAKINLLNKYEADLRKISCESNQSSPIVLAAITQDWATLENQLNNNLLITPAEFHHAALLAAGHQQWHLLEELFKKSIDLEWRAEDNLKTTFEMLLEQNQLVQAGKPTALFQQINAADLKGLKGKVPAIFERIVRSPTVTPDTLSGFLRLFPEINTSDSVLASVETGGNTEKTNLIKQHRDNRNKVATAHNQNAAIVSAAISHNWNEVSHLLNRTETNEDDRSHAALYAAKHQEWALLNTFFDKGIDAQWYFAKTARTFLSYLIEHNQLQHNNKKTASFEKLTQSKGFEFDYTPSEGPANQTPFDIALHSPGISTETLLAIKQHTNHDIKKEHLETAITLNNLTAVQLLADHYSFLSPRVAEDNPIVHAAKKQKWGAVEILLAKIKHKRSTSYKNLLSALMEEAAKDNQWSLVKKLIQYGATINWKLSGNGATVLSSLLKYNQIIENGQLTPLFKALKKTHGYSIFKPSLTFRMNDFLEAAKANVRIDTFTVLLKYLKKSQQSHLRDHLIGHQKPEKLSKLFIKNGRLMCANLPSNNFTVFAASVYHASHRYNKKYRIFRVKTTADEASISTIAKKVAELSNNSSIGNVGKIKQLSACMQAEFIKIEKAKHIGFSFFNKPTLSSLYREATASLSASCR